MDHKIGIIIQARLTSQRFPNKVLANFKNKPIIDHIVDNLKPLKIPIYVAIPGQSSQDALRKHLLDRGDVTVFISPFENEVSTRVLNCAMTYGIDTIVRICADSPLITARDVSRNINLFLSESMDRMIWGMGSYVFTTEMLEEVQRNSNHAQDREHCGFPYMTKSVDWPDDIKRLESEDFLKLADAVKNSVVDIDA